MSVRHHVSNGGKVRIRVATIGTNIAGAYVEWGAEATRERRHKLKAVWWNPGTWGTYEWRREGSPPEFTELTFFRAGGVPMNTALLAPHFIAEVGYEKARVLYVFASVGDPPNPPVELGNDARSIANVSLTYSFGGELLTLSHN